LLGILERAVWFEECGGLRAREGR